MTQVVQEKVDQLRTRAQREIESGLLPSCQIALALDGEVVVHEAFGDATKATRYVIYSSTKPIVASAAWLLIQDGLLDPATRVAELIPEFATNGKDVVTVEQVMLHTSGFPAAPLGPPAWWTREGRLARFSQWRLNWEPGTKFEYHPTSAHWVLAELIERIAGQDYRDFIAENVTGALGLTRLRLGGKDAAATDVAELIKRGEPASPDELEAVYGIRAMPVTEVTDDAIVSFNDPQRRELGVPGGGAVSDAADVAVFYQALLGNRPGPWKPETLADFTGRVRNTFVNALTREPVLRTLGLCIAGDDGKSSYRGFGKTVSGRAFGHNGAAGQIVWADPATGLSFVYLTNGVDANTLRQARRGVALSSIAAECAA